MGSRVCVVFFYYSLSTGGLRRKEHLLASLINLSLIHTICVEIWMIKRFYACPEFGKNSPLRSRLDVVLSLKPRRLYAVATLEPGQVGRSSHKG
jgi:hypothetical protein